MTTTTSLVGLPRTILGSLTTTFTAPTSCAYLGVGYVGNDLVGWEGQVRPLIQHQKPAPGTCTVYRHIPIYAPAPGAVNGPDVASAHSLTHTLQKCDSGSDDGLLDNQACWPGTTAGAAYPDTPFSGWGFYSPGLVCPAGHSSACTATASGEADWPVQFALEAGETAVGCCPT